MNTSEEENKNYKGKDPMSPEQITSHEPTAVKRDPHDQEIAKGGKTKLIIYKKMMKLL